MTKTILLHGLGQQSSSWENTKNTILTDKIVKTEAMSDTKLDIGADGAAVGKSETGAQISVKTKSDGAVDILCPDFSDWLRNTEPCYSSLYQALEDYCGQFDEKVNLCGLSLGGVLALQYAIEHPTKINALILIGAQIAMPKTLLKFQNLIFRFMPESAFRNMGFDRAGVIKLSKSMMDLDFRQEVKKIACPTLIICGEKDKANKAAAQELQERVHGAELAIIPDSGHEVNIDDPVELGKKMREFLAKNSQTIF